MKPEDVPDDLVEKAARARISAQWGRSVEDAEWEAVRSLIEEKWIRHALAAVMHDPRCISLTDSEFNNHCDCRTLAMIDGTTKGPTT